MKSRDEVQEDFKNLDFDFTAADFDLSHYDQLSLMAPKTNSCCSSSCVELIPLLDPHPNIEVTEKDAEQLPAMSVRNPRQYKWMQYMIYRRWSLKTATFLACCLLVCLMIKLRIYYYKNITIQSSCEQGMADFILPDQIYDK